MGLSGSNKNAIIDPYYKSWPESWYLFRRILIWAYLLRNRNLFLDNTIQGNNVTIGGPVRDGDHRKDWKDKYQVTILFDFGDKNLSYFFQHSLHIFRHTTHSWIINLQRTILLSNNINLEFSITLFQDACSQTNRCCENSVPASSKQLSFRTI